MLGLSQQLAVDEPDRDLAGRAFLERVAKTLPAALAGA